MSEDISLTRFMVQSSFPLLWIVVLNPR